MCVSERQRAGEKKKRVFLRCARACVWECWHDPVHAAAAGDLQGHTASAQVKIFKQNMLRAAQNPNISLLLKVSDVESISIPRSLLLLKLRVQQGVKSVRIQHFQ